ncbi:hypothetical protein [Phocaeicola sp.]|nr:hypothetical protein [Phocaeicola sp.]MDE5676615.1 hypothetical protein [Phocaeicola sp.]
MEESLQLKRLEIVRRMLLEVRHSPAAIVGMPGYPDVWCSCLIINEITR